MMEGQSDRPRSRTDQPSSASHGTAIGCFYATTSITFDNVRTVNIYPALEATNRESDKGAPMGPLDMAKAADLPGQVSMLVVGGNMVNSGANNASAGSIYLRDEEIARLDVVREFLNAIRVGLDLNIHDPTMDADLRDDMERDLETAELHLRRKRPDHVVVKRALASLKAVCESFAGSGAWAAAVGLAHHLPL